MGELSAETLKNKGVLGYIVDVDAYLKFRKF